MVLSWMVRLAGAAGGTAREDIGPADMGLQHPPAIAPEAFADALEQKALGAEKLMDCVVKVVAATSQRDLRYNQQTGPSQEGMARLD